MLKLLDYFNKVICSVWWMFQQSDLLRLVDGDLLRLVDGGFSGGLVDGDSFFRKYATILTKGREWERNAKEVEHG